LVTALTGIAAVRLRALNPNAAEFTFAWCVFSLVVGAKSGAVDVTEGEGREGIGIDC
jgi:hypothetical protein